MTREEIAVLWQQAVDLIESQAEEIKHLREIESEMLMIGVERAKTQFKDEINAQAAEIDVLKIAHKAHQTSNLKMLAILKQQAFDLLKHRALCDQMGNALNGLAISMDLRLDDDDLSQDSKEAFAVLEAWRALK